MHGLEPLIPISLFVSVAAVLVLRGPLGKALGHRLGGRPGVGEVDARTDLLEQQLEEVQYRLHEVEERLDFAERVVTQGRGVPQIQGED